MRRRGSIRTNARRARLSCGHRDSLGEFKWHITCRQGNNARKKVGKFKTTNKQKKEKGVDSIEMTQ